MHSSPPPSTPAARCATSRKKRIYVDQYTQNAEPGEDWADERTWPVSFWYIDTGMATLLMLLTVVDEGLAACYFGIMPAAVERLRAAFGVPHDHEPIGAVAIGFGAETSRADYNARRRPLDQMIHNGS
jgi:nitroreductase